MVKNDFPLNYLVSDFGQINVQIIYGCINFVDYRKRKDSSANKLAFAVKLNMILIQVSILAVYMLQYWPEEFAPFKGSMCFLKL